MEMSYVCGHSSVYFSMDFFLWLMALCEYNWPMSAHASQAFSIAHCTDYEDLPKFLYYTIFSLHGIMYQQNWLSGRGHSASVTCVSVSSTAVVRQQVVFLMEIWKRATPRQTLSPSYWQKLHFYRHLQTQTFRPRPPCWNSKVKKSRH